MAESVSRRPLTADAWVLARASPCGICVGKSDTGIGFSPISSVFPCEYSSTVAPYSYHLGVEQYGCWWPQLRDMGMLARFRAQTYVDSRKITSV
jgi:hypothetical protein